MKVFLTIPHLSRKGGVSNFYQSLLPYLHNKVNFFHFSTSEQNSYAAKGFCLVKDIIRFCRILSFSHYDIVFLNPSLGRDSVIRDGLYCLIAKKIFKKKIFIFWHGWDKTFENHLENSRFYLGYLRFTLLQADTMCVLAKEFKNHLKKWKYRGKILQGTTTIPDELIEFTKKKSSSELFTILFLSRLEKTKGVYEILYHHELLLKQYSGRIRLVIAGTGSEEEKLHDYVKSKGLPNVEFTGHIQGEEKYRLLASASIFTFPSTYGEGLPCALLEAMGAGLPVLTSPAGGIPDFFENGIMGFMIPVMNQNTWVEKISELIENPELAKKIGAYNRLYAEKNFRASVVAKKLLHDLEELHATPVLSK